MMKKSTLITILLTCMLLNILSSADAWWKKTMKSRLNGYIEIAFDGAIDKIFFPSDKMEEILKKLTNQYYIGSFDVSPDGKDRILEVEQRNSEPERLIMFSNSKEFKVLVRKDAVREPAFSPDSKTIAYLYGDPRKEPKKNWIPDYNLYLINADGTSNRQISNLWLYNTKPSWFPDGKRLAVSTRDFKIYIINTETGEEKKIIDFGLAPSVSHDGKKIAYLSKEIDESVKNQMIEFQNMPVDAVVEKDERAAMEFSKLFLIYSFYIYDMDTGKSKKLSKDFWVEERPIWSPDDRYLLFNDRRAVSNDIYVLDTKTGEAEEISSHKGRVMTWRN